jgi:undecaprenyl pyrophosphate synthase
VSEELVAGGALVVVALVGLIGTVIQSRKTRQQNTDQHAEGRAAVSDVLDHIIHLHTKVDHVAEVTEANGRHTASVEAKVDTVTRKLDAHVQLHEGA